jgi:hypothetical protein
MKVSNRVRIDMMRDILGLAKKYLKMRVNDFLENKSIY